MEEIREQGLAEELFARLNNSSRLGGGRLEAMLASKEAILSQRGMARV
jgi:hypothetical protein